MIIKKILKIMKTTLLLSMLSTSLYSQKQKVVINLPAYTLKVIEQKNNKTKEYRFRIGIGRGDKESKLEDLLKKYNAEIRNATPTGKGFIYEKRKRIVFRYGKSYPNLGIKKGDIIKWNNTFDAYGNPIGYWIDYKKLRGLAMKIKREKDGYEMIDFVIHSNLDEFTCGLPSSHGCIRLSVKDMLKLYDIIAPEKKQGKINIPLNIIYDVLEIKKDKVIIHANVYNKKIDYFEEFIKEAKEKNINKRFDYEKIKRYFSKAQKEFFKARKIILEKMLKPYPYNYVPEEWKAKLHKTYPLSEFELKQQ